MPRQTDSADQVFEDLDSFMNDGPVDRRHSSDEAEMIDVDPAPKTVRSLLGPNKKPVLIAGGALLGVIALVAVLALQGYGEAGRPEVARELLGSTSTAAVVLGEETGLPPQPEVVLPPEGDGAPPAIDVVETTPPPDTAPLLAEIDALKAEIARHQDKIASAASREQALLAEIQAAKSATAAAEERARKARASAVATADLQLMLVTNLSDGAVIRDGSGAELIAPLGARVKIDPRSGKASLVSSP